VAKFQYDAQGRRAAKTIDGTTTGFLYGGLSEANMAQELLGDTNTAAVKSHIISAGIDETLLREISGKLHSVLPDGNNNTVRLLDGAQAKVVDYTYEPYGRTSADANNANTQQYTGRENDDLTNNGLYYYRNRYYMPGCMRFISEDPIGWASGQTNDFAYVGGSPLLYRDPWGFKPKVPTGDLKGFFDFFDDYYAGKEAACSHDRYNMWAKWRRDTLSKPFDQWTPSDYYIAQNAGSEMSRAIADFWKKVGDVMEDATSVDSFATDFVLDKTTGAASGPAVTGVAMSFGVASGCR
jgi:RHS repeat-associated protein